MVPKQAWERLYVFMVRDRYEGQMSGGGGMSYIRTADA